MQSQDHLNAVTSVFHLILTIIAPHAGNPAREMTPVSPMILHAIFVQVSLRNSNLRLSIGVGTSGNRRHWILVILERKEILTFWVMMWRRFLALKQTLRVLLKLFFSSPPHPQPLRFESLSLKTPQTVPPTPGTALQNKIESGLEKSLGNQFNIQLQQMGVFQVSMLEAMKSLRDEMHSMKKASESDVVQTSNSLPKAAPSKQPDLITTRTSISTTRASDHSDAQPVDTDHYGPPLPPNSTQSVQSEHASRHSDIESDLSDHHFELELPKRVCSKAKKQSDKRKHKAQAKYYSQSSSSGED